MVDAVKVSQLQSEDESGAELKDSARSHRSIASRFPLEAEPVQFSLSSIDESSESDQNTSAIVCTQIQIICEFFIRLQQTMNDKLNRLNASIRRVQSVEKQLTDRLDQIEFELGLRALPDCVCAQSRNNPLCLCGDCDVDERHEARVRQGCNEPVGRYFLRWLNAWRHNQIDRDQTRLFLLGSFANDQTAFGFHLRPDHPTTTHEWLDWASQFECRAHVQTLIDKQLIRESLSTNRRFGRQP